MKEKVINAELIILRTARGEEHKSTYEVRTSLSEKTTVGDLADFVDGMRKLWAKAMQAAKHSKKVSIITMEVCEAVYEHDPEEWKQLSFNRWYMRDMGDISTEKGEESIYLVPDTRYTEEYRDMCIGKDILRDMAYAMR